MGDQRFPPARMEFVAAVLMPDDELREAFLGDLAEEYAQIASSTSVGAANRWYGMQLVRSAVPLSVMTITGEGPGGIARFVLSALSGVLVNLSLMFVALVGVFWLFALALRREYVHGALAFGQHAWLATVLSLAICAVAGFVAGSVAVIINRRSAIASALAVGFASILILVPEMRGSPAWFYGALSITMLTAALCGALFRIRDADALEHASPRG